MLQTAETKKQTVFTGLKPTGQLTIGNYIGVIKNMVTMQSTHDCFYSVVDMHSITVDIDPAVLRKNTIDVFALFLAAGVDPDQTTTFIQSHVPQHAVLTWILNCYCYMGEAKRMIQFKEKSKQDPKNINLGLFDYPVLMAADILLYNADLVPIGKDQKQHLELAKTLAERFNSRFSPTFTVPKEVTAKGGAKVFSLVDPSVKMGKTDDNPNGVIYLLDDPDTVMRKLKRAVTDSGSEIVSRPDKKGISNLLTIYSAFSGLSVVAAQKQFKDFSYAQFKEAVATVVADELKKLQAEYRRIVSDKAFLEEAFKKGREKAQFKANRTLAKVMRKVGFVG